MLELRDYTDQDKETVWHLYKELFPAEERIPFSFLLRKNGKDCRILVCEEEGKTVGFTVVFLSEELVCLAYLAVVKERQDEGLGSAILAMLAREYGDRPMVVDIEECSEEYPERLRRKEFYLRAAFRDTGIRCWLYGVDYELLSLGGPVTMEMFRRCMGYSRAMAVERKQA